MPLWMNGSSLGADLRISASGSAISVFRGGWGLREVWLRRGDFLLALHG